MVYSIVIGGGIGDLIAVSAVTRTMQKRGHQIIFHTSAERATVTAVSHLGGCDGWITIRSDGDGPVSVQTVTKTAMLLPDAHSPAVHLGYSDKPAMSRLQCIASSLGFATSRFEQPLWLVQPWERAMAKEWVWSVFEDCTLPVVYIGNMASLQQRSLPTDRATELCLELSERGFNVILNETTGKLQKQVGSMSRVVVADQLQFAVRAAVLSEADCCISADTGVLHIAVAVSTPTIAICGPYTFDHVCRHYAQCFEAPVTKRFPCYGCNMIPARGYTESCEPYGCKNVAAMDVTKIVALAAKCAESTVIESAGCGVRYIGHEISSKGLGRKPVRRVSSRRVVRETAEDTGASAVIVTGADSRMSQLSSSLVGRLQSMSKLPVIDISPLVDWGFLFSPSWVKAWLWDILPASVQKLLWLDADAFPVRRIDSLPDVPMGFAPDPWERDSKILEQVRRKFPLLQDCDHYFNCGVFIAERKVSEPVFAELKRYMLSREPDWVMEQNWLNAIAQHSGSAVEIPAGWNWLVGRGPAPADTIVAHMCAGGCEGEYPPRDILPVLYDLADQGKLPEDQQALTEFIEAEFENLGKVLDEKQDI